MNREIKQDFTITYPVFWAIAYAIILLYLVIIFIVPNRETFVIWIVVTVSVLGFTKICLRAALRESDKKPKWILDDAGLVRGYSSTKTELIRWEDIQHMKWVKYVGLVIRWNDEHRKQRSKAFQKEFRFEPVVYRQFGTIMRVQEDEAVDIMHHWRLRFTPATDS